MKGTFLAAAALCAGLAGAAGAQTPTPSPSPTPTPTPGAPTTVAAGTTFTVVDGTRVNGVNLQVTAEGDVWFLESSADLVSVKRGNTITSWQLRPDGQIGANPVEFRLDGDIVWMLQTGQSDQAAGTCAISKLDTTTGEYTQWIIPGSIPAGFVEDAEGNFWIPQSGGRLQKVNLETLRVFNYRSEATSAYADVVLGPDGALWLADFGNNRIVRYVPDAETETFWQIPSGSRLNTSQIGFDSRGDLWLTQLSADRLDRFSAVTGTLSSFYGINNPIHFEIFQNRLYVTSTSTDPSQVTVFDPALAPPLSQTIAPLTFAVSSTESLIPIVVRTTTLQPSTFESVVAPMDPDTLGITGGAGYVTTMLDSVSAYGVTVAGGVVWVGTNGKVVSMVPQVTGEPEDPTVPVATQMSGAADNEIRIDITLSNPSATPLAGQFLYLYSQGASPPRLTFLLPPGATEVLEDATGNLSPGALLNGPIRFHVTGGNAEDLLASVRSLRVRPSGGTFGYALPTASPAASLGPGSSTTLFTGARAMDAEVSVLGLYTALDEARGLLTLLAPDGTVRGLHPFVLAKNTHEEFNPVASAFGVDPEPGDVVAVSVESGSLQAYVNVVDLGTLDVAAFTPVFAAADSVIPSAGALPGANDTQYLSDLFLSNPDPDTTATISVAFYPLESTGEPLLATVELPPGQSQTIQDFLPTLFGVSSIQGSALLTANVPFAAATRIVARKSSGDYAGFAPAIDGATAISGGSALAIGLPQTSTRRTNLMLYNRGDAGAITVTGFLADGGEAGQLTLEIGDHVSTRLNSVFAAFGVTNQPGGRIRIDAPAGMNVYAWTAAVDGVTGDVDLAAPQ